MEQHDEYFLSVNGEKYKTTKGDYLDAQTKAGFSSEKPIPFEGRVLTKVVKGEIVSGLQSDVHAEVRDWFGNTAAENAALGNPHETRYPFPKDGSGKKN